MPKRLAASPSAAETKRAAALAKPLLAWYARHHRALPWRAKPGEKTPRSEATWPYRVWLSEVMLQQTTVPAVIPYFGRFLKRWPDVAALAAAKREDVLAEWAGLGYYARARNLHACAQMVAAQHGGRFPETETGLRALPGIGAYTAAAIAAIAFNRRAGVLDGNIERVLARVFAVQEPLRAAKEKLRALSLAATPEIAPGDFAQALMDLGASLCAASAAPACAACPLKRHCLGFQQGIAASLPVKAAKKPRPVRHTMAFLLTRSDGAVLFRRRAEKGLLGGMLEVPSAPWRDAAWTADEALAHAPAEADWQRIAADAEHGFTHFALKIGALTAAVDQRAARKAEGLWLRPEEAALPTVFRKMLALSPALKSMRSRRGGPGRP